MRGKIVNLCIGCMNILFGILLFVYTIYIPQEMLDLTIQELRVTKTILNAIYIILAIVVGIDVFQYRNCVDNTKLKTSYLFGFFALSFIFIKEPAIAIFTIIAGICIIIETFRDTIVDIDSTTAISVISLVIVAIVILVGVSCFYKNLGAYIKNQENKNNQEYTTDYFKYITELEITEPYINVKKEGKYGYMTPNGEVVIDFKYDYASPFVNITMYNKEFQVALVCQNGVSKLMMKNERTVLSYSSESSEENYDAKWQELEDIYTNTLGQGGQMQTEIVKRTDNMQKVGKYEELSEDYTYRYDYNEEYDILVTQSNLGLGDKFELAKKENLGLRITLDCENMDYDENYLYLYSNLTIPFFDVSSKEQGWFTKYGKKNTMTGKAQILDFVDDKILIKNYNDKTIYFIDANGEAVSDIYQEIYMAEDQYIVKNSENRYMVIGKDFTKSFEEEFDCVDPYLADYGLYIMANTNEIIHFNDYGFAKMNWKLVNRNGETMLDGIEQIYGNYYQISNDKSTAYVTRYEEFLKQLKQITFHFVGDKFYSKY